MDLSLILGALLGAGAIGFLLFIRVKDIPKPVPESPFKHLEERKAAIYENLRDLQFEYRLGKLSDEDYQKTKLGLQGELAKVLAEIDSIKVQNPVKPVLRSVPKAAPGTKCPHCGATFDRALKFCGECGKAMA